jgi:2,4-dienoyl-CoA reductase-like NADH-dependent reductase (Old Yellow Enzyme family)
MEIHAAHGFDAPVLSLCSNFRTDEYGGSFENRIRLTLEVLGAIRMARKFAFIGRISASDWAEGGWNLRNPFNFLKF